MNIIIDDSTRLVEIQKEFNTRFPYLKLEFFAFEPDEAKRFTKENLIQNTSQTLGEVRHVHIPGHIKIEGRQKVKTLEDDFRSRFGLNVQVFRKTGNSWILTSATDNWTLDEQNKMAMEMSAPEPPFQENYDDTIHEQI